MRVPALALALLVAGLGGCGDSADPAAPTTTPTTAPTTSTPTTSTPTTSAPTTTTRLEAEDECEIVTVEPGSDGIAWLAASHDPWGFTTPTVAVDDGFVIGTSRCVTVVDTDGAIRWSRLAGNAPRSTQVGRFLVVLTSPELPGDGMLAAYDIATGETVWEDDQAIGVWEGLLALDEVVVVTGTGEGLLIATLDAATGELLDSRSGRAGVAQAHALRYEDMAVVALSDEGREALFMVGPDGKITDGQRDMDTATQLWQLALDGDHVIDPSGGTVLWSARGWIPTPRHLPPNHTLTVSSGGVHATIACAVELVPCHRTEQRVVAVVPAR